MLQFATALLPWPLHRTGTAGQVDDVEFAALCSGQLLLRKKDQACWNKCLTQALLCHPAGSASGEGCHLAQRTTAVAFLYVTMLDACTFRSHNF